MPAQILVAGVTSEIVVKQSGTQARNWLEKAAEAGAHNLVAFNDNDDNSRIFVHPRDVRVVMDLGGE